MIIESVASFILGSILGSFANVIIVRLPQGKSIIWPRSHCVNCKKTIPWYDNIPILSWFFLGGKCRFCQHVISWRYPVVEFLLAVIFVALFHTVGFNWLLLEYFIFAFGLVAASFIDFEHMLLPNRITLSGIIIGLIGAALNPDRVIWDALIGLIIGGGFLWFVAYIYWIWRKEEGMGGGDIKLIAWIGAVLGWKSIPFVIIIASILGSIVGALVMLIQRKNIKTAIPFGPYLALSALLYIFGGSALGLWYLQLFLPWIE